MNAAVELPIALGEPQLRQSVSVLLLDPLSSLSTLDRLIQLIRLSSTDGSPSRVNLPSMALSPSPIPSPIPTPSIRHGQTVNGSLANTDPVSPTRSNTFKDDQRNGIQAPSFKTAFDSDTIESSATQPESRSIEEEPGSQWAYFPEKVWLLGATRIFSQYSGGTHRSEF